MSSTLRITLSLAVLGFITGLLVSSGDLGSIDTVRRLNVTHSLWTSSPPVSAEDAGGFGIQGQRGVIHAWYGVGQSIAMLPADVLATALIYAIDTSPRNAQRIRVAVVSLITFPLIAAATLACAFLALRALGFSHPSAILGTLGLQFLSTALHFTQCAQENSLLLLTTLAGFVLAMRGAGTNSAAWGAAAGSLLGFGLLVRLPSGMSAAVMLALAVYIARKSREPPAGPVSRFAISCVLALVVFLLFDRLYHWWRFGTLTNTYIQIYGEQARRLNPALPSDFPFSNAAALGLKGFLFSPHRSLFLFEPLLVLTAGLALAYRGSVRRPVGAFLFGAFALLVAYCALYCRYVDWAGGTSWGPRFLSVPAQLIALVSIPLLSETWKRMRPSARTGAIAIASLALVVQSESLVFWANLEESQGAHWGRPPLVIWQRAINIAAACSGDFERSPFAYPGFATRHITPNFLVFLARPSLPNRFAFVVVALWSIGIGVLCLGVLSWARGQWRLTQKGSSQDDPSDLRTSCARFT